MIQSKVVCVLGMHRSGSSATTRVLNLLGAYLGPDDRLVPPAPDNPKGYWEHRPIVDLNDALLARLGGRSMAPPALPTGWETAPELDDLVARAREIIDESFSDVELWAWKDPRACLTLPFWHRILPPMLHVICVRDPVQVAESLWQRNRISRNRSVYLWLLYTSRALSDTAGRPRCFSLYDRLMDDPMGETAALARFLDMPRRAEEPEVRDAIASFLDSELMHHRTGDSSERLQDLPGGELKAALHLAETAYLFLAHNKQLDEAEAERLLQSGLDAVHPSLLPVGR